MSELIPIIEKIADVGIGVVIVYGICALIVFGIALTIILYIFRQIVKENRNWKRR